MNDREGLLEEKARLLGLMLAETERQGGLIAERDADGFLKSAGARQALIDEIDALDARLRASSEAPGADTARIEAGIRELLSRIIEKDGANRNDAAALSSVFKAGIREANIEKSLLAYRAAPAAGSRFVNKKG